MVFYHDQWSVDDWIAAFSVIKTLFPFVLNKDTIIIGEQYATLWLQCHKNVIFLALDWSILKTI